MQNLSMLVLAGANFLNESLGVLDGIMTTSFEKWLMDEEIIERARLMAAGVSPEREPVSLEAIREVGHAGTYLTHPDTLARFRKRWRAPLAVATPYEQWDKAGREDMLGRARRKLKTILEQHAEPILSPALERDLAHYIEKHLG